MLLALVALVLVPLATQAPRSSIAPPTDDVIFVDGSKNPELIPQWNAWGMAFRIIAGGSRLLPTMVHLHVSEEEAALIYKEAEAAEKIDPACEERMSKLRPLIGKEKNAVLNEKAREILLDCRRQTLSARDRVLKGLRPEGQLALIAFAESTKTGTTFTIRKSQLARFLEPE